MSKYLQYEHDRKVIPKILSLLICICLFPLSIANAQAPDSATRWMVKLKKKDKAFFRNAARQDVKSKFVLLSPQDSSSIVTIQSDDSASTSSWLSGLLNNGDIVFFEPDYVGYGASGNSELPNDSFYASQWYLNNDGSHEMWNATPNADINMPEAWEITQGDENIIIAILDSGVGFLEPDLAERFWINDLEKPDNIDNDQNGYVDDQNGYDFINDKSVPQDDNGHGTGIAGIIGARTNNNLGISGINAKSKLMICKVLNGSLSGNYSEWIAGIYYAVDNGADVINMSVIGKDDSRLLHEAILYAYSKGVAIYASMGNENLGQKRYPAAYPETIAVGSSDPNDQRSTTLNNSSLGGSNFGSHIDVLAPGNFILGLNRVPGATTLWSGTSMSSAVACGVGSLILSLDSTLTVDELQSIVMTTAKDEIGNSAEDMRGWDQYYGFGRIDAFLSLEKAKTPKDRENIFYLSVYPNPTVNKILNAHIVLDEVGPVKLEIIDTQGRIVKSMHEIPESRTISISIPLHDHSTFIYILRIITNKRTFVQRFILN